jgi:hypothetical protein
MLLEKSTTKIARSIVLDLDWYGGKVVEEALTSNTFDAEKLVKCVFPGQPIEHLARGLSGVPNRHGYKVVPSSAFFSTAYTAFDQHHAFGLRPEVLMYLVNSVIAETVRRHPEDYRHLFTTSPEKIKIMVRHDGLRLGDPNSPWGEAIPLVDAALRPHIPSGIMESMLPSLSTATLESSVASLIAFMDAASPYYSYGFQTMCGIPRIELFGEAADYRKVFLSASSLATEFPKHLGNYFANLLPVLDTIATTAETGKVDEDFWSSIYKHHSGSGTSRFSGWLSAFIWYVQKHDYKKKTCELVVKEQSNLLWHDKQHRGVDTGSEPAHITRVPFVWEYFGKELKMHLIGGVLGVDVDEGALTPKLSYGVLQGEPAVV